MNNNFSKKTQQHFNQMHADWWNPTGICKLLHRMNPIRLQFIINQVGNLQGKKVLDVGCGGGILSESLAVNKAQVVGLDTAKDLITVAQQHAKETNVSVQYYNHSVEDEYFLKKYKQSFHVLTCMELLEHLDDPEMTVRHCVQLVEKGGHVIFSTLNRTMKSWLYAIVGAEYILRWLPYNTHHYRYFIRPAELATLGRKYNLTLQKIEGMHYNFLLKRWMLTQNANVNYLIHFQKTSYSI